MYILYFDNFRYYQNYKHCNNVIVFNNYRSATHQYFIFIFVKLRFCTNFKNRSFNCFIVYKPILWTVLCVLSLLFSTVRDDSYNDFHLVTSKQFTMLLYRVKIIYQNTANYYVLNYLTMWSQVKTLQSNSIYYILYNVLNYIINNTWVLCKSLNFQRNVWCREIPVQ